jgi:hypothetical protein
VYPADDRCRVQESHSKWHEEGGNGLLDLMFLSDDLMAVTSQAGNNTAAKAKLRNGGQGGLKGGRNRSGSLLGVAASKAAGAVAGAAGRARAFAAGVVSGYQSYVATVLGGR